jgi:hypothetical protein
VRRELKIGSCLFIALALLTTLYCSRGEIISYSGQQYQFNIDAVVVWDMNSGEGLVRVTVMEDSSPLAGAQVKINLHSVAESDSGEYSSDDPSYLKLNDSNKLSVIYAPHNLNAQIEFDLPDTLRITALPQRLNPGGESRVVYWKASQKADGYFVSVIGRNATSTGAIPYSSTVEYQQTQFTIPPDAFRDRLSELKADIYLVHVVAYSEGFIPYEGMPFTLPEGLPEATLTGADGSFGCGVVAPYDSIIVPQGD